MNIKWNQGEVFEDKLIFFNYEKDLLPAWLSFTWRIIIFWRNTCLYSSLRCYLSDNDKILGDTTTSIHLFLIVCYLDTGFYISVYNVPMVLLSYYYAWLISSLVIGHCCLNFISLISRNLNYFQGEIRSLPSVWHLTIFVSEFTGLTALITCLVNLCATSKYSSRPKQVFSKVSKAVKVEYFTIYLVW